MEDKERAAEIAKRAAAPDAVTEHRQPLGNRPYDDIFWLQTYNYATAASGPTAQRSGGFNLHTVYISAWRAANAGLHGGLSNAVI